MDQENTTATTSPGMIARALRRMDEIQRGPAEYRKQRDEQIVRDAGYESMEDYQNQLIDGDPENAAAFEPLYTKALRPVASILERLRGLFDTNQ